jgi:hypothetical protein
VLASGEDRSESHVDDLTEPSPTVMVELLDVWMSCGLSVKEVMFPGLDMTANLCRLH